MAEYEPINWVDLAAALLDRAHSLVPQWLPHGVERNGRWYVGDFDGGDGESANVNLHTGQWIDNAAPDEDKGGDLISLYARIRGLNNGQAARELMRDLGWQRQSVSQARHGGASQGPAAAEPPQADAGGEPDAEGADAPRSPQRDTRSRALERRTQVWRAKPGRGAQLGVRLRGRALRARGAL